MSDHKIDYVEFKQMLQDEIWPVVSQRGFCAVSYCTNYWKKRNIKNRNGSES